MSNNKRAAKSVSVGVSIVDAQAPATAADVEVAARLIPSARVKKGWIVDPRVVEPFSNLRMQNKLRSVSNELSMIGIDVDQLLQWADEGAPLLATLARLNESTGRVQQRLVELNKRLKAGQTRLVRAHRAASPNTPLAQALQGLVGLRANQMVQVKRTRTRSKNHRGGAATTAAPSSAAARR